MAQELDADTRRVCDLIVASGRPPIETLTPPQAREAYLASRPVLQPDPEPVAEVAGLTAAGPAGPIPLRLYRGQGCAKGSPQPALQIAPGRPLVMTFLPLVYAQLIFGYLLGSRCGPPEIARNSG